MKTTGNLKKTQIELIQTAKLALIDEICTGLAHELNQPLGIILLNSQFLQKKLASANSVDDKVILKLQKIDEQVARALNITTHLKNFSRDGTSNTEKAGINKIIHQAFILYEQTLKTEIV